MSWLVDNASALYVLLAIIAAGLAVAWWFNKRVKFLLFAQIPLALMVALLALTHFVVSDAKQLEMNVHAMADAVRDGKVDDLFKHISNDFNYKGMTRQILYEAARRSIDANKVQDVKISAFSITELTPKFAKTRFRVTATGADGQTSMFVTEADFVKEGTEWKLKTVRFFNPLVNQDQEIGVPGL